MKNFLCIALTAVACLMLLACKTTGSKTSSSQREYGEKTETSAVEQTVPAEEPKSAANDTVIFRNESTVVIKERSDYRTYINGKYAGLTYRESETYLKRNATANAEKFSGKTFVVQDTRRNLVSQVKKADEVLPVAFTKHSDGTEKFTEDSGFPLLREMFDTLDKDYSGMSTGTYWDDTALVSIFPLKERGAVVLPVIIRFSYAGHADYLGEDVLKIQAKYALRNAVNPLFKNIFGTRDMEIFLSIKNHNVMFVREKTAEQFTYNDGTTVKNEGTLLHFFNYVDTSRKITIGGDNKIKAIETQLNGNESSVPKIEFKKSSTYTVENTELGLQLRLKNLRFVADKDTLLAGEESKLDEIATVLKNFSGKKFFVEGHTASTGQPANEKALSELRAFAIVAELTKRGIPEKQFLYSGAGASKPLVSNDTPQGMAENRRVEITILD